jgi:hypothetical protein
LIRLVEPHRDLGLEQAGGLVAPLHAGGQIVLADAKPPAHLSQELQRGDPVARLDPRDIRGRAAGERELALTQTGSLARLPEATADRYRVINMS